MDVTWRDAALVDALGTALTPTGVALLENELADERLAVITLLGARLNQQRRAELVAHLLHASEPHTPSSSESAVTLLACVSYMEEDYRVLVLDVSATQGSPAWELVGVLCALSSLVVTCYDDADASTGVSSWFGNESSSTAVASELPQPFTALLDALLRDHAVSEVHELAPNLLTLDCSSPPMLQTPPHITTTGDGNGNDALASIVALRQRGVATVAAAAEAPLLTFFAPLAPVKRVFGVELSGARLLQLLQAFARDVQRGDAPDVSSAWDDVVERQCAAIAADALSTYSDCLGAAAREHPPMEREAFDQLHDELTRLALDVFHSGTRALAASSASSGRKRSVRNALKGSLRAAYERETQVLHESSQRHCESVKTAVWRDVAPNSGNDSESDGAASFTAVLDAVLRFDDAYCARASGPAKDAVLRAFYRHEAIDVFKQLEALVTRQMTEIHLQELRAQLEREFEGKKEALVAHFKSEETQLRACMARELETMQKMHQMRSSRVKIDESESKRVREQLEDVAQRNAELESSKAALEQTLADSDAQRAALERQVHELHNSVQLEMASRAELVDTLATTIKSAEDKECALMAEVSELRHELGEKTFRVESELKELSLQLRKTNEEKDELQKRLSEFFLRVTMLPAALQQQLFCTDPDGDSASADERVHFADALSGFMSE